MILCYFRFLFSLGTEYELGNSVHAEIHLNIIHLSCPFACFNGGINVMHVCALETTFLMYSDFHVNDLLQIMCGSNQLCLRSSVSFLFKSQTKTSNDWCFFFFSCSSEAAKECNMILDIVESALPNGLPKGVAEDCKLQEMLHKALELLPELWTGAGFIDKAIVAYRRALTNPWNLDPEKLASIQKKLASTLLYSGIEVNLQVGNLGTTENNTEEAILLLLILMRRVSLGEIKWDEDIMHHLTYALSITGQHELLAEHFELILPGVYDRVDRWYCLALCYASAGQTETALNLLKKVSGPSEAKHRPHLHSFLLGAKLCSEDSNQALDGINFARAVVNSSNGKMKHFSAQARELLGNCYGQAARISISDSERAWFQKEALRSLNEAVLERKEDPGIMYSLGLENAVQRNLNVAFDSTMVCSDMFEGNSVKCWKLIALILSAEKRFSDAKEIIDFSLDEVEMIDQLELLRIKAFLEIAEEEPKQAIETYKILLALIETRKAIRAKSSDQVKHLHKLEVLNFFFSFAVLNYIFVNSMIFSSMFHFAFYR